MIESATMWALSVYSYLTPAVLFLLLNLVIGTIAVTSKSTTRSPATATADPTHFLARSPSLVLQRLKSFAFSSPEPESVNIQPEPEPEPETVAKVQLIESQPETAPEVQHHIDRSQSDTKPTAGEVPQKLPKKMKKSATVESALNHFEFGDDIDNEREITETPRRPATMREREKVEMEVDARADDFINRFRHQLKLAAAELDREVQGDDQKRGQLTNCYYN